MEGSGVVVVMVACIAQEHYPTYNMCFFLSKIFLRSLRRADPSSRGELASVYVSLSVVKCKNNL